MTLKALDLQVLLPKTQEVGRIQQIQQKNEYVQQQGFAAQFMQESEIAQRSVQHLSKTREGIIKERKKQDASLEQDTETSEKQASQQEKSKSFHPDHEQVEIPFLGCIIDLKI
jgi:hypothetical protein